MVFVFLIVVSCHLTVWAFLHYNILVLLFIFVLIF